MANAFGSMEPPSDAGPGLGVLSGDKEFEDLPKEMLKLFKEVEKTVDRIIQKWSEGIKDTEKATGDLAKDRPGAGRLGLGSFTRGEKAAGLGLGVMAVGSAYMSMAPNTMAAVTQRMGADTYAGFSGMSSRQAILQANRQVGAGATSAMGPTMAAMNLMYSGGYTANSITARNVMGQLGGLSAMTGMSNEQAAASVAGINGMNFLRMGIRARDAQGNLRPPNQLVNEVYNFLYRGQKITKEQAALIMNPGSKGYQTLLSVTNGDQALMQTLQAGIMARASNGKPITAAQMHDPNAMLNAMGVDQSSPIRANFRFNASENRKLAATEEGLVGGYDASLRTAASLNDAYSRMADILGPVNDGLMTLKGILQTFPNAGNMGGTVSNIAGAASGVGASYLQYKLLSNFLGGKPAASAAGNLIKGGAGVKGVGVGLGLNIAGNAIANGQPKGGARSRIGNAAKFASYASILNFLGPEIGIPAMLIAGGVGAALGGENSGGMNVGTGVDHSGDSHGGVVYPVPKATPVSSPFGPRPGAHAKHPGISANHKGMDFGTPEGTAIHAIRDGVVISTGSGSGYGNYVLIRHYDGTTSRYAHLKQIIASKNQKVKAGDVIGRSGGKAGAPGSGNSTGPHLHLEITNKAGVKVNPAPYLSGAPASNKQAGPVPSPSPGSSPFSSFLSAPGVKNSSLSEYSTPTLGVLLGDLLDKGAGVSWNDLSKKASARTLQNIVANIPEYDGPITGNKKELMRTIAQKGFKDKALRTAYAIAIAESGGRPNAIGDVHLQDSKWGPSVGLFQIRSLKHWRNYNDPYRDATRLTNPQFNSEAAYIKSKSGKNFKPWTTYNSGAFVKHLAEADSMAAAAGVGGPADGVNLPHGLTSSVGTSGPVVQLEMKVYIQQASVVEAERLVNMVANKLKNNATLKQLGSVM